jgi:hypothetical protein
MVFSLGPAYFANKNADFIPLLSQEWTTLRTLAKVVWTSPTVEDFTSQTTSTPTPLSLTSLPTAAHDILAAIAYARRHTPLFLHLVATLPPPPTPCFSLFDWKTIDLRIGDHFTNTYQHSAKHPSNIETEARYWVAIIRHGWIGVPEEETLEQWLMVLAHQVTNPGGPDPQQTWAIDISSPTIDELQSLLAARGRMPSLAQLGHFLAHCPDLPRAQRYFTRFPGPQIAASPAFFPSSTGNLLVPLIESSNYDDGVDPALRADMVRLVLETLPGLDVNAHVDRPHSEMRGYGKPAAGGDDFAALHAAAWRGDVGVGRVLVDHGARLGERERVGGLDAAAGAWGRGFVEFAEWAEGVAGTGTG